jgi:hypothetical protein
MNLALIHIYEDIYLFILYKGCVNITFVPFCPLHYNGVNDESFFTTKRTLSTNFLLFINYLLFCTMIINHSCKT